MTTPVIMLEVSLEEANLIVACVRQLPHAQVHDLVVALSRQIESQVAPPANVSIHDE